MADQNQVRTLSIRQIMDSSDYVRGARDYIAANREMAQSSSIVGQIVTQTQVKISNAADGVTRLVRAYDPATASAIKFQSEMVGLNKALETGKLSADGAARVYAGMVQKFGMVADGADILSQGFTRLGNVVANTNTTMADTAAMQERTTAIRAQEQAANELAESYARLAQQARSAQAAENSQAAFNRSFAVAQAPSYRASDSAAFFEEELRRQEEERRRVEEINRQRSQQLGQNFASDLNSRFGIGSDTNSARASAAVFEEEARAVELYAQKADLLRAAIDPVGASQARLNAQLEEYGILLNRRDIDLQEFAQAEAMARARHEQFVESLNRKPGAANDNNAQFRRQNLGYQAFDVGQGLASGMPLPMILAQQGPQIAQIYAMEGGAKALAADFAAARAGLVGMVAAIGPVGWAFAGVTAAAGAFYLLTRTETKTTDELLKVHAENIKALGEAYGIAEEKAKSYSEAEKAIALAKAQTSTEDLQSRVPTEIDALYKRFGTPLVSQNGPTQFNITGIYAPFEKAFTHLKETADPSAFVDEVNKIGQATGYTDLAKQIVTATENFSGLKDAIDAANRSLTLVEYPNAYARSAEAAAAAKLRIDNTQALVDMQRQHSTDLAGIGARSPAEMAAAARARVMAEPLNPNEDQVNRQYRANAAAALAYAQAENELSRAKEDRVRQSEQELAKAQLELSLIGKTVAEQNRLRAEYQATAAIKEAAAQAGIKEGDKGYEAFQREMEAAKRNASEIAAANAKIQASKMLQDQDYQIEQLQLEANLIGASVEERNRATAALQAEQQLRQQGIELLSREGQQYVANAKAMADARTEIDRQNAAYQSLQQAEGAAIDTLLTGSGSMKDVLRDASKWFVQMAAANPLKNMLTGTNLPTLGDLFSGRPSIPGASSTSTAMMNVQATTVTINGGVPGVPGAGGLAGLLGVNPANNNVAPIGSAPVIPVERLPLPSVIDRQDGYVPPYGNPLGFVGNYKQGVDPRLSDILNQAALRTNGYQVQAFSGYRPGDPRFHGQGLATDVRLIDPTTGQALLNYQDPATFRAYEQFAQNARMVQMQKYPELNDQFRWGGYFSGPPGKYGAMDQMHFDLGGSNRLGMAGGTWERGLNPSQRSLFPGVNSQGMNSIAADQANSSMMKLSQTTTSATKDLSGLGDTSTKLGSSLTDALGGIGKQTTPGALPSNYFPPAPAATPTAGGFNPFSIFTSLFSLFGFADGTDFSPGGLAWVGERGRELVNLPRGSKVTPNHKLNSVGGGGGGSNVKVDVGVTVDNEGNLKAYVKSVSHSAANEAAASHSRAMIQSYNDEILPGRVQEIQQNPRMVG